MVWKRYNLTSRILHRMLLSHRIVRSLTFEFESYVFSKNSEVLDRVFICGLARAGTSALLRKLYLTDEFCSTTYLDVPFILSPNTGRIIYDSLSGNRSSNVAGFERDHGDGLDISLATPEAFEEVFWLTFDDVMRFKTFTNFYCRRYRKQRYLSKNNQNVGRIEKLVDPTLKGKVILLLRNPIDQCSSLLEMHKHFSLNLSLEEFTGSYMVLVGHTEFGKYYIPQISEGIVFNDPYTIEHWLEQWLLVYGSAWERFRMIKNVKFVSFDNLINAQSRQWLSVTDWLDLPPQKLWNFSPPRKLSVKLTNRGEKLAEECMALFTEISAET